MGGRLDYNLFEKIRIGTTVLQENGEVPETVPQVGNYGKDLLVYGADVNAKDLRVTDDVGVDFGAEVAHSRKKENAFGYAMIDSMNEASIRTGGSMVFYDWTIAANPNDKPAFLDSVSWDTQEVPSLEINPHAISTYNEKQQVLVIDYDFSKVMSRGLTDHDEISLVYPLSTSGVDLSEKTSFELTMLGEGAKTSGAPKIDITFGNISERSDSVNPASVPSGLVPNGYGMYTACSPNTPAPKTEDVNCLSTLAPAEDVGWWFANPDGTLQRFDPFVHNRYNPQKQPNGRIDSQDLNQNGKYDEEDPAVGTHFGYNGREIYGLPDNSLAYDGWKTFTSPLYISSAEKGNWTAVRHLRITLKYNGKMKGTVKIANVALSGTSWNTQEGTSPEELTVSGINNVDNTNYVPIFASKNGDGERVFNYLYGSLSNYKDKSNSDNVIDQALNLAFDTRHVEDDSLYANRNFGSMDFTQHKEFRFLLYSRPENAGSEFFMKVGTAENYDQIIVPLDYNKPMWRLISVRMSDRDGDGIADVFENTSDSSYGVRVTQHRSDNGRVNFKKVSMIMSGVRKTTDSAGHITGTGSKGTVWLNVIHLAEGVVNEGTAYKVDGAVRLDGWGSVGAKYKHMDSFFETPLTVAKNQEVTEEEYFLKVNRIQHFPMEATLARSKVVTPNITDTSNYNTVSSLDKGKVERQQAQVRGDFIKDKLPQVGLQYNLDKVDYEAMRRKDQAQTYAVTVAHNSQVIKNLNAGYSYTNTTIDYEREMHLLSESNYNTDEETQRLNMKATYEPSQNFNITPSYSISQSKEERVTHYISSSKTQHYPKGMNQSVGFNSTWRIFNWLAPSVSYNIVTTESNNLTERTLSRLRSDGKTEQKTFDIGEIKSLNRSSDGGVTLTLNGNELLPNSKLFKNFAISSGYRIQDADSWYYVDEDFNSKDKLWIRSSALSGTGDFSSRQSLVLRDTITSSQRWMPFAEYDLKGVLAPVQTISLLNNFTQSVQQNNQTGTESESRSMTLPDLVFSISDLEKFFLVERWLSASNLKLRYSAVQNETVDNSEGMLYKYGGDLRFLLFNFFDTVLIYDKQRAWKDDLRAEQSLENIKGEDWSVQTSFYLGNWRFTPKMVYSMYEKRIVNGQLSQSSKEVSPSLTARLDFNLPRGIKLPFLDRNYTTTNRVIWNTTLSYKDRTSPVEVKDNYHSFNVLSSLDYELSQNLRFNVAGEITWLNHTYVETEDYIAYNVAANLTIQF